MNDSLSTDAYFALREEVGHIIAEGKVDTRRSTQWERVETYWNVGNAIYVRVLQGRERADYGEKIISKLASDMQLGEVLLHDTVRFRRAFNILSTSKELTWSHYRTLIRLPTVDQRRFYERAANRGAWRVRRLQREIQADLFQETVTLPEALPPGEDPFGGRPLRSKKGIPYTYSIRALPKSELGPVPDSRQTPQRKDTADPTTRLRLDVGFGKLLKIDFTGIVHPRDGLCVTSVRSGTGPDASYHFRENATPRRKLYTYPAEIIHVTDGDTVDALLDCGFGLTTVETLRLRGIDTPELSHLAGQRARQFVTEHLTGASVVVTTTRKGKYGRYIADIYYLPGTADPDTVLRKGAFLNRELLLNRLAVRYDD